MKIYIDENIPYAREFFSDLGDVFSFAGREVTAEQVKDADILLVRSITKVNEQLLALNNNIKFVGTATIGTDHIDIDYLKQRDISFSSAPGCNKVSVADYVLSALLVVAEQKQFLLADKKVAIVGAGNTGSAVYQSLTALGVECILYDPPLAESGDTREFCGFDEVLSADIISLHVPKVKTGAYPTIKMFDKQVLEKLSTEQVLVNACRGEVIDNQALLQQAQKGLTPTLVLDVWENEPDIETALLPYVCIATPHIAGYSLDGKLRGTEMLYQALCKELNIEAVLQGKAFIDTPDITTLTVDACCDQVLLKKLVHLVYDVRRDDALFRVKAFQQGGFDKMRKEYPERRELSTLSIDLLHNKPHHAQLINLQQVGFTTKQ